MMRWKRSAAATAAGLALALGVTACGGGSSAGSGKATKGGTLTILNKEDYDHIDPQRTYTTEGSTIDQLLVRTLTAWDETGSTPKLVGDLASGTGTPTQGDKVWTFHLRSGVKWQDGTPVTSQDLKYGIEREFSPDITSGPPYAHMYLANTAGYTGPFKGKSLSSIETPDAHTIVFHLNQPVADFNETTAMTDWSAVPKAHDTGATYDRHMWSDGPYKIQSYSSGKQLVLVKNTNWSQSTDPIRQQNVNKVDVKIGMNETAIDQQLEADSGTAQTGLTQFPIAGSDLTTIANNKALSKRYYKMNAPAINYLALNTKTVPLNVRKAIEYGVNKQTFRGAFGGAPYGDYATTMLAPSIQGHKNFSLYTSNPAGDLAKAKQALGSSKPTLSMVVENIPTQENAADAVKNALAKIGIKVNIVPLDGSQYFSTIANTKNSYDIYWADWIADWPNASTVLPTLFNGAQIKAQPQSNNNYALLNDPAINAAITKDNAMTDLAARNKAWGELDQQIVGTAAVVPMVYMTMTYLTGSKVGGILQDPILGEPSLVHAFVKS